MSKEYPCVYWNDGKCKKFSDDSVVSWCVQGPCEDQMPSNADRIRAMGDEELCDFLGQYSFFEMCDEGCDACTYKGNCDKRLLEWLKQPAEVTDNAR